VHALESHVSATRPAGDARRDGQEPWFRSLKEMLGESLLAVILFGSTARGEERDSSDIDLLIVVSPATPLTRGLYALWDEHMPEERYSPHFVHLPGRDIDAGSIWYEAAVDGIVLYEAGRRVSRFLIGIRRKIAAGALERKTAYGHPYWVKREEEESGVQ
jgi:predicted nucleotidyltransferase